MKRTISQSDVRFHFMGDQALLIRLVDTVEDRLDTLLSLVEKLEGALWDDKGVIEWTMGYDSIAFHYDPLVAQPHALTERVRSILFAAGTSDDVPASPTVSERGFGASVSPIVIPVLYGGEFGPDLDEVARHAGLAPEEVVQLHGAATYRVALIGFAPGFPYLEGLDARLTTPRRAQPRQRVAAGSVGIAGRQTGIYSFATPGGWQIIGRTPIYLFDTASTNPALLWPGAYVQLQSITREEYDDLLRA